MSLWLDMSLRLNEGYVLGWQTLKDFGRVQGG